jgi:hypothetical protein
MGILLSTFTCRTPRPPQLQGSPSSKLLSQAIPRPARRQVRTAEARTPLFCEYRKQPFEATVLPSGEVEFAGWRYATPSAAATAARETLTGDKMGPNGWTFWRVEVEGKPLPLAQLRSRL